MCSGPGGQAGPYAVPVLAETLISPVISPVRGLSSGSRLPPYWIAHISPSFVDVARAAGVIAVPPLPKRR